MDKNPITMLDGSKEEREMIIKQLFGLSPEQSYQELKIEPEENEYQNKPSE